MIFQLLSPQESSRIYEPGPPPTIPPMVCPPPCGLGWGVWRTLFYRQFQKGKAQKLRIYILFQKTFVRYDLKAKGARNIREFQRKTAHGSRPAQNVINYVSTAPARADRGSDPSEKHTKAKNIRHSSQNTASMPILC